MGILIVVFIGSTLDSASVGPKYGVSVSHLTWRSPPVVGDGAQLQGLTGGVASTVQLMFPRSHDSALPMCSAGSDFRVQPGHIGTGWTPEVSMPNTRAPLMSGGRRRPLSTRTASLATKGCLCHRKYCRTRCSTCRSPPNQVRAVGSDDSKVSQSCRYGIACAAGGGGP